MPAVRFYSIGFTGICALGSFKTTASDEHSNLLSQSLNKSYEVLLY
jgi:hypothetical protein